MPEADEPVHAAADGAADGPAADPDQRPEGNEEPGAATAGGPADPGAGADDLVQTLEAEVAALRDRLARALADYSNLQKRIERDAALERERVKARVLEGFLQVYEYGQMAAFEAERNPGPLADGVKMVVREFDRLLQNEGVRTLGTEGERYDRTIHEACATESKEGIRPGHVSRVISPGYRLGERVLRYAKVAVEPELDEEE